MPDDWALSSSLTQIEKLTHVHIIATSKRATKNTLFQNLDFFLFFFLAIKVSRDALIRQDGLGNNTAKADLDEFYAKTQ